MTLQRILHTFVDSSGAPLVGKQVTVTAAGRNTPETLYTMGGLPFGKRGITDSNGTFEAYVRSSVKLVVNARDPLTQVLLGQAALTPIQTAALPPNVVTSGLDGKLSTALMPASVVLLDETSKVPTNNLPSSVATLDGDGKIPIANLPASLDDVVEYSLFSDLPATGDAGKLYVVLSDGATYRWNGSSYVLVATPNLPAHNHVITSTFSLSGDLIVMTGETRWYPPRNGPIVKIEGWVSEAPAGASLIAVINKNGAQLASVEIATGATKAADQSVSLDLTTSDYLSVDVTQVGSTTAGKNLTIRLTIQ